MKLRKKPKKNLVKVRYLQQRGERWAPGDEGFVDPASAQELILTGIAMLSSETPREKPTPPPVPDLPSPRDDERVLKSGETLRRLQNDLRQLETDFETASYKAKHSQSATGTNDESAAIATLIEDNVYPQQRSDEVLDLQHKIDLTQKAISQQEQTCQVAMGEAQRDYCNLVEPYITSAYRDVVEAAQNFLDHAENYNKFCDAVFSGRVGQNCRPSWWRKIGAETMAQINQLVFNGRRFWQIHT